MNVSWNLTRYLQVTFDNITMCFGCCQKNETHLKMKIKKILFGTNTVLNFFFFLLASLVKSGVGTETVRKYHAWCWLTKDNANLILTLFDINWIDSLAHRTHVWWTPTCAIQPVIFGRNLRVTTGSFTSLIKSSFLNVRCEVKS